MATDSNEKIKWVCFWILIELHSIFHKGCITKFHLLFDLLGKEIMILNKMNTILYRAYIALSEYIFIFIL